MVNLFDERFVHQQRASTDNDLLNIINEVQQLQHTSASTHHHSTRNNDPPPNLTAPSVVQRFKKLHKLSTVKAQVRERNNHVDNDDVDDFYDEVLMACEDIDDMSLILNADETRLPNSYVNTHTIHHVNEPAIVNTRMTRTGNNSTTAVACIAANGNKLPLFIIKKGKTEAIFNRVTKHNDLILAHNKSNWCDKTMFRKWIDDVLLPYTRDRPAAILLDSYSVHFTNDIELHLADHNIRSIRIPENNTSINQPLDVGVFGPAKQQTKTAIHNQRIADNNDKLDYTHTIEHFYQSFKDITRKTIRDSFKTATNI